MKKNRNRLFFIIIGISIQTTLFSQINFVPGYIVKLDGDTVRGSIDYRNWSKNPNLIHFKTIQNDIILDCTPLNIKTFSVKDEIYKSAIVNVESTNVNGYSYSPVFAFRTDTVFLQTLFQGTKSLYYYKDKYDHDNFYIYNNSQFELLEYKIYVKKGTMDHEFIASNKRYIGQLKFYLQDCPDINEKIKYVSYTDKSLQKLFRYYYSKMTNEAYVSRTNESLKVEFGVTAGISMINLYFFSDRQSFYYLTKGNFSHNLNFVGGAVFNVVLPRNNGKWSIYNEIFYNPYTTNGLYVEYHNEKYYLNNNTTFGYTYIKLNDMLRFSYPVGKLKYFVNTGISNGFALSEINHLKVSGKFSGDAILEERKALDDTKKYEIGFLFGLGAKYDRFSVELRYETANAMSKYLALNGSADRYFFLLGYRF